MPVNLDIIISKKNIDVLYEENQVGIDGLCQLQKNPPRIILNTEVVFEPRRRFTLAHEIGHICIPWHTGVDLCSLDDPYVRIQGQQMVNTQELEANIFASELLMPTSWLKTNFKLDTEDLADLVKDICRAANTSIMACFYALENVLPAGDIFFVKTDIGEFWKAFRSVDTNSFYVSVLKSIPFYDKICYWKNEFRLVHYNVVHYKMLPEPDLSMVNKLYIEHDSSIEKLLSVITKGNPIYAIPYIDKIINQLDDKFYVVIRIGDVFLRHFRHPDSAIRMHSAHYEDVDALYEYIKDNFYCYGRIQLSSDSCMLWVKEYWRGNNISDAKMNPNTLLKMIVAELYPPEEAHYMLQSINGIIASINSGNKAATREQLFHLAKIRFETDEKYKEFAEHYQFEQYVVGKIDGFIIKRNET